MSLAYSPARLARRRRRFLPAGTVEALEPRALLTVAAATSPLAYAAATDLHAQFMRLQQLNTMQHAGSQVTAAVATHVATAQHATATHHVAATSHVATLAANHAAQLRTTGSTRLKLNNLVVYGIPGTTPNGTDANGTAAYTPIAGTYTAAQVRTAYGVAALGSNNLGQGTTIAIIDEFDDPNITGDANVYSAQYNLPQFNAAGGPTLTVYKDQALGTVTSAVGTGVGGETSLDVELAHAMAPLANILLVEVPATGTYTNEFAQLLHGVQYAAAQPGVVDVSLSYGIPESYIGATNIALQNNAYLATGPASLLPITISAGDGSTPLYPATSPNVIAVGGTSVYLASVKGRYGYETAWGGLRGAGSGGGGTSTYFAAPTFQSANGVTYGTRAIPDVSLIADPVTAVSIYDSLDVSTQYPNPWGATGGTSVAAPVYAGMLALAQQNRLAAGQTLLTSAQINAATYKLYNSSSYSTYFHDITMGNNKDVTSGGTTDVTGYTATTGYDLATGVGSPIGNTFVPYLSTL